MGLFNKYKSKTKIGKSGLVVARYDAGGYALIKKGRIIEDNVKVVSRNVFVECENDNKNYFYIKTKDGNYRIYSFFDGAELFDLKEDEGIINVRENGGTMVLDFVTHYIVINPKAQAISEEYANVGDVDENNICLVEKPQNVFDKYYYVNDNSEKISPDFALKKDAGKNKIIRYCENGCHKDFIWSHESGVLSQGFESLNYINGRYLAVDYGKNYFVDVLGNRMTKNLESLEILPSGVVIAREQGDKHFVVYDDMYGVSAYIKKLEKDENSGIYVAETLNGKTVLIGEYAKTIQVVDNASIKFILNKINNNRTSKVYANQIVNSKIDFDKTLNAYLKLVSLNYKNNKKDQTLKWIFENAGEVITRALNNYKEKAGVFDDEKLNIFFDKNIVRDWQEELRKKHESEFDKE